MLKLAGAEIILVPAAPYSDAKNYVRQSEIIAAERKKPRKMGLFGQINGTTLPIEEYIG